MMYERIRGRPWSKTQERLAVALWASFLAAIVESGIVCSYVNPWTLYRVPEWLVDSYAVYGILFFVFWICTFAASALTAYLLDPRRAATGRSDIERP